MFVLHPIVTAILLLRFWTNIDCNDEPPRASPTISAISALGGGVSHSGYGGRPFYPRPTYARLFLDYVNPENARNGSGPPGYETAYGRWTIKGHIRTVSSALVKASSTLYRYVALERGVGRSSTLDKYVRWRPCSTLRGHISTTSAALSVTLSSTLDRYPAVSSSVNKSAKLVRSIRPAVYETSCVRWQPDSELQKGARVVSALLSRTLGERLAVSSAIDKYIYTLGGYAVRAHDAACRALRPQPVPVVGFLRANMSVPSTLGFCGRGTESLHPIPPRATPIPVFWKVVSAPRAVIICFCFVLLALTTLHGYAERLYFDAGIYLSPVYAPTDSQPLPSRASARPSPVQNVNRRGEPSGVNGTQRKRPWIRRID
ncbi:hypothetical protein FRC10_008439 [Ceratobasidium sp. 414]|nr:hypothetical protein FRC10_008439 [Ceratobasidium sp. 414]